MPEPVRNLQARTMWLPLPALAVPVRVTVDSPSSLDALAKTLLRLIAIRPRNSDELASCVGLPPDLVNSALAELLDRGLVETDSGFRWKTAITDGRLQESEIHQGWAFIVPSQVPQVIPRLWLGKKLPRTPILPRDEDVEIEVAGDLRSEVKDWLYETKPRVAGGSAQLSRLLRRLIGSDEVETVPWPPEDPHEGFDKADEEGEKPVELPELGTWEARPRIASIDIDEHVRATGHSFHYCVVWSQVDFLHRIAGPATALFHEPELIPERFAPRPITDLVPSWLEQEKGLGPLLRHVRHHAEAMKAELSLVLRLVGIDSEAALEREVESHRAGLEKQVQLPTPADGPIWQSVIDEMRDAWRWNIIAKLEPEKYIAIAQDRYAHSVEALIQTLREFATPLLEIWRQQCLDAPKPEQKRWKKERGNKGWMADRSGIAGIGHLGPSEAHVLNALQQLHRLPDTILDAGQQPAGTSITLWLLPIFLLSDDEAVEYARPVARALDRHPLLMTDLSDLLEVRNATFHKRHIPELELTGRKLFATWASLAAGYTSAAFEER